MTSPDVAPVIEANTSPAMLFPALVSQPRDAASFDLSQRHLPQRALKFGGQKTADHGPRIYRFKSL
jgi:hypothetical protein